MLELDRVPIDSIFLSETAVVKNHFWKTLQILSFLQNSKIGRIKSLSFDQKLEKLDFYNLSKSLSGLTIPDISQNRLRESKQNQFFVGNLTWKATHLYPLGLLEGYRGGK